MAIIAFTGTPGSGKTYEAVQKIVHNLMLGKTIHTNIDGIDNELCREMIKGVTGLSDLALTIQLQMLDHDEVYDFWNHVTPRSVIVLDEVQNYFSSRDWQSEKNKDFARWSSTHRHHGFEVILITQNLERIDTAVRSLVEWCYVFRKVNFFGSLVQNSYMCYGYGGSDATGRPLTINKRIYDKKIFLCYKSYVTDDIKEMGVMKHINVLKHPVFYAIPVVIVFTVYMVFFKSSIGTGDIFGSTKVARKAAQNIKPAKKITETKQVAEKPAAKNAPNIFRRQQGKTIVFTNRIQEPRHETL